VIFYKNGVSLGVDENQSPKLTGGVPGETPYYMEAELNSPMVSLIPGESYRFDTEWFPTRAGDAFVTADETGIVTTPVAAVRTQNGLLITGQFGVFFPGKIWVNLLNARGSNLGQLRIADADPLELLDLHTAVAAPTATTKISLHVVDENGNDRGVLGEADVQPASRGTA
jgi:hypothetical protein